MDSSAEAAARRPGRSRYATAPMITPRQMPAAPQALPIYSTPLIMRLWVHSSSNPANSTQAASSAQDVYKRQLLEHWGYHTLFPYAAGMVALSFLTMCLVRHGDSKPVAQKGLEALDVAD